MAMNNIEAAHNISLKVCHHAEIVVEVSVYDSMLIRGSEEQKAKSRDGNQKIERSDLTKQQQRDRRGTPVVLILWR